MGGDTEYGARESSAFSRNLEAGPGTTIGRMDALLTRGLWQYAHCYDPVTD